MKLNHNQPEHRERRGVSAILIAAMMFVFVVCCALTVDVAYMQLIRTELRVTTDAAAKAAAETLARTESTHLARKHAKAYATQNRVAGKKFFINDSDVVFGRVERTSTGAYEFTAGGTPENSVQVVGRLADDARTKPVSLFFAPSFGQDNFSTSHSATAAQQDVEVCLCLDRSGSMAFDMTGVDWAYPSNIPNMHWSNSAYYSPPHPTDSRWSVLAGAIELFIVEAGKYDTPPRTGLVTWAHTYSMPFAPHIHSPTVTTNVSVPALGVNNWANNSAAIRNAMNTLSSNPVMGGTNMTSGLNRAIAEMTGPGSATLANKIIILLSDGVWNLGGNPRTAAGNAAAAGITIHTISMLSRDQDTLEDIADLTGGRFYVANDQDALVAAFVELARTLPVVLTE